MVKLRDYQKEAVQETFAQMSKRRRAHPVMALPTGAGKSYIIAEMIRVAQEKWKVDTLVISHVKEIIKQDYDSLKEFIPDVKIYSAGLGSREVGTVTVAGIQSIHNKAELFKRFKMIIIDECHLISPNQESMYQKFFKANPNHIRVGLTATPFRLGTGYIYEGANRIFDYLSYDLTSKDNFNQLVKDGYLCRLVTKGTDTKLSTEGVRTTAGDYNDKDLSAANDKEEITNLAIKEICKAGEDRRKWLLFAIDIAHAEHIAEGMMKLGILTNIVHSKMEMDRSKVIEDYKNGKYRCIVNVNVLTTGFDDPDIDLIGILRPTKSPVLHVQTIGRGLRVSPNKRDCLVLDFAGNTARLGPINDVQITVKKKGKKQDEPVMKECPICHLYVAPAVRVCECGHEFVFSTALESIYSDLDIVAEGDKWLTVDQVTYEVHKKRNSPNTMRVTYHCGLKNIREWICVEHKGYAKIKADHWLKFRGADEVDTAEQAVAQKEKLSVPKQIQVDARGKYPVIKDVVFLL